MNNEEPPQIIGAVTLETKLRCSAIGDGVWALGLSLGVEHPARKQRAPTRFHFVLDNSGSMRGQSRHAKNIFAELVTLANEPCSLTAFSDSAKILSSDIQSPERMRELVLPRQSTTNITDGVEKVVDIILDCEATDARGGGVVHHTVIFLSDGYHTKGPDPRHSLPSIADRLKMKAPNVKLSIVVVGVTSESDTSIGMLIKQRLETVPLPDLSPIYFAPTQTEMETVLGQLRIGLTALKETNSGLVVIKASVGYKFVRTLGHPPVDFVSVFASGQEHALVCVDSEPPTHVVVDNSELQCETGPEFSSKLVAVALQGIIDDARMRRISTSLKEVKHILDTLNKWITSACRYLSACGNSNECGEDAKELFEKLKAQIAEIIGFKGDSAAQACFLIDASAKYGSSVGGISKAAADSLSAVAAMAGGVNLNATAVGRAFQQGARPTNCDTFCKGAWKNRLCACNVACCLQNCCCPCAIAEISDKLDNPIAGKQIVCLAACFGPCSGIPVYQILMALFAPLVVGDGQEPLTCAVCKTGCCCCCYLHQMYSEVEGTPSCKAMISNCMTEGTASTYVKQHQMA